MPFSAAVVPTDLERRAAHRQPAAPGLARLGAHALLRVERRPQAVGLRAAHPYRRLDAGRELVERALRHELAAADHDDLVDRLRHLGQHVARHEHGAALAGLPAQEVAQPADALRVEPVGGLVEHERRAGRRAARRRG